MQYIPGVGLDRVLARLEHAPSVALESGLTRAVQELLEEQSRPPLTTAASSGDVPPAQPDPDTREAALRPTSPVRSQVTLAGGTLPPPPVPSPPPDRTPANTRNASHWDRVARLGLQVADALHYAHAQGTLHRDIKPANLIIDPQGVVWVADFGLAKALEHDEVSHSGDIVGTLAYMAPEQLRGQADRRSDIYSLGADPVRAADVTTRVSRHGPHPTTAANRARRPRQTSADASGDPQGAGDDRAEGHGARAAAALPDGR